MRREVIQTASESIEGVLQLMDSRDKTGVCFPSTAYIP